MSLIRFPIGNPIILIPQNTVSVFNNDENTSVLDYTNKLHLESDRILNERYLPGRTSFDSIFKTVKNTIQIDVGDKTVEPIISLTFQLIDFCTNEIVDELTITNENEVSTPNTSIVIKQVSVSEYLQTYVINYTTLNDNPVFINIMADKGLEAPRVFKSNPIRTLEHNIEIEKYLILQYKDNEGLNYQSKLNFDLDSNFRYAVFSEFSFTEIEYDTDENTFQDPLGNMYALSGNFQNMKTLMVYEITKAQIDLFQISKLHNRFYLNGKSYFVDSIKPTLVGNQLFNIEIKLKESDYTGYSNRYSEYESNDNLLINYSGDYLNIDNEGSKLNIN